jgi:hypothetical protein
MNGYTFALEDDDCRHSRAVESLLTSTTTNVTAAAAQPSIRSTTRLQLKLGSSYCTASAAAVAHTTSPSNQHCRASRLREELERLRVKSLHVLLELHCGSRLTHSPAPEKVRVE